MSSPTLHDEVAVRQLVTHLTDAWNHHDGVAFGQPFREDAEYRVIWGNKIIGRDEIAQGHHWLFTNHYAHTRLESAIESIRFLRPDVAYIEASFKLHNATMPDGSPYPFEKAIAAMTAVKEAGEWAISTFNNGGILRLSE
jgi:uncharacterized protein (TIGR02246 family)